MRGLPTESFAPFSFAAPAGKEGVAMPKAPATCASKRTTQRRARERHCEDRDASARGREGRSPPR